MAEYCIMAICAGKPRRLGWESPASELLAADDVHRAIFILVQLLIQLARDRGVVLDGAQGISGVGAIEAHDDALKNLAESG